ncbi:MAG TPA: hypothetical protein VK970_15200, partial [Candidatus Methylacidiphilales bacterium]|nr:hypothetical protein [Candidatus Methylacidiphilales bacterium]
MSFTPSPSPPDSPKPAPHLDPPTPAEAAQPPTAVSLPTANTPLINAVYAASTVHTPDALEKSAAPTS